MESMSRISSILENARDLTLEAARDASAVRRGASRPMTTSQLKKLLDSRNDREVLEGMRQVVSRSYLQPQSSREPPLLFSSVLKNIASPSLPVKKLVYIYLLQHAEAEPDTALLAINTIQKSLSAPDPHLRALALRVMSGIRVPVISQIVSLGIKRGVADMSPLVRKAAALAVPKCWRLDPNTAPQLTEYLSQLLGDRQYFVTGAAVAAFMEICPERIDLIHKHYRSLVRKLVDMDEWGQLATLRLMTIYARKCFPQRTKRVRVDESVKGSKDFYGDDEATTDETAGETKEIYVTDPDLELLLKAALPLLQSRNSAVTVSVARLYLSLTPPSSYSTYLYGTVGPLVSLLRDSQDIQQIALYNIVQVALAYPTPFTRYATHFLVKSVDSPHIWRLKLELLTIIFPYGSPHVQSLILTELSHFCSGVSTATNGANLIRESVRALGRCALQSGSEETSSRCLRLLLAQVTGGSNGDGPATAEALTVIRHLIQANPAAHLSTVTRLAKNLDTMVHPQARASVTWLVGEFAGVDGGSKGNIAADFLRILAKGFADEAEPAKLQIVLLAAKVYVHHVVSKQQDNPSSQERDTDEKSQNTQLGQSNWSDSNSWPGDAQEEDQIEMLWNHVLLLARYDTSYDLRDRARVYKALLSSPSSIQLARLVLLAPKPVPQAPSPSENSKGFTLGSASLVIGADEAGAGGFKGYEPLPDWVKEGQEPDPNLRNSDIAVAYAEQKVVTAAARLDTQTRTGPSFEANGTTKGAKAEKSLDAWLAEDEESDSESEESEESELEASGEEDEEAEEDSTEEETSDEESENLRAEQQHLIR